MDQHEKETGEKSSFLTGRVLLAMPAMGDPRFHRAVIYMCAHDENGAMGLVVNHVLPGIDLTQLLEQLHIEMQGAVVTGKPVMSGGPVETARGFVLHSNDFSQSDTIRIDDHFSVTGTLDALKAIASGQGPEKMLFILGYAGWSAGQLDEEIRQNAWMVSDPDPDIIFTFSPDEKWGQLLRKLGIDPGMISGVSGSA